MGRWLLLNPPCRICHCTFVRLSAPCLYRQRVLQLRCAGFANGWHAAPKGQANHRAPCCILDEDPRAALIPAQQLVKVVIIIDSFGPLSGYMIVIGSSQAQLPSIPRHPHRLSLTRAFAGDALQVFIASFDSTSSPALSKAALTAYAVMLFIGSRCARLSNSQSLSAALTLFLSTAVPLCFLKTLDKLGFTSILSLVPLVYLLIFQVRHYAQPAVFFVANIAPLLLASPPPSFLHPTSLYFPLPDGAPC